MELLDERRRPLTVDEYRAMARAGILSPDDRVELIGGRIIAMSPIRWSHANIVLRLSELLWQSGTFQVSVQNPLRLDRYNEPHPDVALLRRDRDADGPMLASHAVLVVEVADSSLSFDGRVKLPRYARAGIPEAWIVDVEHRRIEVFRHPENDVYMDRRVLTPADRIDEPGGSVIAMENVFL